MAFDLDEMKQMLNEMSKKFTPEYLEELARKSYHEDREYPENFSNWYPHILDFGEFKHVDIINNQIFTFEETELMRETDNFCAVDWKEMNRILEPTLAKMHPNRLYSIKNGCFSNKFDFQTSLATKQDLAEKLWKINYNSSLFDTGGYTELVVRELIPNTDDVKHPTIYNGMPLREEVRVFYNMDTQQIEYCADYWDYDYCKPNIHSISDKIVFDYFHNKFAGRHINHDEFFNNTLLQLVTQKIPSLKFDGELKGIWSIDFLWENADDIYLIDMARGYRSAYWDKEKCKNYESEE